MRFLCFGVGAIGTYIGGSLALSGNEVVFIERPEQAEIVRKNGLHLKLGNVVSKLGEVQIVTDVREALPFGEFDAAIFAVKSFDTITVMDSLQEVVHALPPFLCLQNGVENESLLRHYLGEERVITGTVTSAIGRLGVGDIVLEKLRGVGIDAGYANSTALAETFKLANLRPVLYSQPQAMKWSKMLTNLLANATSAILDMKAADIFADPIGYQIEVFQMQEILQVMRAMNLPVVNLPGTPVRALTWAMNVLPSFIGQPLFKKMIGGGRGDKMPSFHIDLYNGRGTNEVEYLNGAVSRFGDQYGIATPINKILTKILLELTHEQIPLGTYQKNPFKLWQAIQKNLER